MSSFAGPSSADDFGIIDDLLLAIEQDATTIEPRRLLAYQYEAFGWSDAAADAIQQILALDPYDQEANDWILAHLQTEESEQPVTPSSSRGHKGKDTAHVAPIPVDLTQLKTGYTDLMSNAKDLLQELAIYQELCPGLNLAAQTADLKAISEGRITTVIKVKPPPTARSVATKIKAGAAKMDAAMSDLEATARWMRNETGHEDVDKNRDAVRKRAEAIKSNLPEAQRHVVDSAFMHIEHEQLGKTYQNEGNVTMFGDPISSIPRAEFWVSEDGYAWDMSELAQAIKANGGVMRNPLSKQMFTAQDVKNIIRHKSGSKLAALQAKQKQLTQGVREETIDNLDAMAKVLLADQSDNAAPSRQAVDEFLAFLATLPEAEQTALHELRVPASDSHTGASFDVSIGQAVDDAKANRQCFHKTGDHLRQAAVYLRKHKGAKMPGAWS